MVDNILGAISYGIQYVVCICIPHGHMTMSHDHVVCLFGHAVFLFENIPHGCDYFHPQQN